jgi:hypothetical protein
MWISTFVGFAKGRVIMYNAAGRTPDEKYLIADFGGPSWPKWRVLRVKNGISGGWTGEFGSPNAALAFVSVAEA